MFIFLRIDSNTSNRLEIEDWNVKVYSCNAKDGIIIVSPLIVEHSCWYLPSLTYKKTLSDGKYQYFSKLL